MKSHYYWKRIDEFKVELREAIPTEKLRALHQRKAWLHLAYAGRQFAIIGACSYALWHLTSPLLWIPFAVLQGFTFFNMTTLPGATPAGSSSSTARPCSCRSTFARRRGRPSPTRLSCAGGSSASASPRS